MSQFKYFPETDTLSIDLSNNPATGGALNAGVDGEDEDMLLSVDKDGRITNITIERASSRVDLSSIKSDDANIIVGGGKISYTASGLARELGVSRHSIQTTAMRNYKFILGICLLSFPLTPTEQTPIFFLKAMTEKSNLIPATQRGCVSG